MKQASKSLHKAAIVIMAAILCCWRFSPSSAAAEGPKNEGKMSFAEQCAEQEKLLKEKLSGETLWTDAKRKDELVGYLKMVAVLRVRSVAPMLARWIAYDPALDFIEDKERPFWVQYPVYNALLNIGIPSIPHLLTELKKTNPKDGEPSRLKHALLVFCISDIYEQGVSEALKARPGWQQGEHGNAMAKKRLELELAATKDEKEQANLQAALDLPCFKEQPPKTQEK